MARVAALDNLKEYLQTRDVPVGVGTKPMLAAQTK
jgi:hypothetical protein